MERNSTSPIEARPGKCGGKPCIRGTRIRVQDIYIWHELQGKSPDDIVSEFPELSLSKVYAALAYFWEHQAEIKAQIKKDRELAQEFQQTGGPSVVERLTGRNPASDAVSS